MHCVHLHNLVHVILSFLFSMRTLTSSQRAGLHSGNRFICSRAMKAQSSVPGAPARPSQTRYSRLQTQCPSVGRCALTRPSLSQQLSDPTRYQGRHIAALPGQGEGTTCQSPARLNLGISQSSWSKQEKCPIRLGSMFDSKIT